MFVIWDVAGADSCSQADVTMSDAADVTLTLTQSSGGHKRRLSSADVEEDGNGWERDKCDWKQEENVALLLLCHAQCLVAHGKEKAAVKVLNK